MATLTFLEAWYNDMGVRYFLNWGEVTITVPDGEVITSGENIVAHTNTSGNFPLYYVGMAEDGSVGFAGWSDGDVSYELTNIPREGGSDFPPNSAFDTSVPLICFLLGTLIARPEGSKAVEELTIGDLVLTADGRAVPVKWIGRQIVYTTFGMAEGRRPVCISAGALGNNLPDRDLRLTADHALLIDNVLVHAGALVNGTTIRRMAIEELGQHFTVYHVETESHDVILAEGMPAETFIDNVSRTRFDNYAEYEALYGPSPASMEELSHPRAMSRRQVPASVHARIADAAAHIRQATSQAA